MGTVIGNDDASGRRSLPKDGTHRLFQVACTIIDRNYYINGWHGFKVRQLDRLPGPVFPNEGIAPGEPMGFAQTARQSPITAACLRHIEMKLNLQIPKAANVAGCYKTLEHGIFASLDV